MTSTTRRSDPRKHSRPSAAMIALFRYAAMTLALGVVMGLIAVGYTWFQPQQYRSTVTLMADLPDGGGGNEETSVATVQALVTSSVVLDAVSESVDLSPRQVEDRLTVERQVGSALIQVSVDDTSRTRATKIAEAVLPTLEERLAHARSDRSQGSMRLGVVSFSETPQTSVSPRPFARNAAIGFATGAVVAILGIAWVTGRSNTGWSRDLHETQ